MAITADQVAGFFKRNWKPIAVGAAVLVALTVAKVNMDVTNEGNRIEAQLTAKFSANQTVLSSCVVQVEQAADIAVRNDESVRAALVDTVQALSPQTQEASSGKLFSALKLAYPDTSNITALYDQVMSVATGCRADFAEAQAALLDRIRHFDAWREGSQRVRWFGSEFPDANLKAVVGKRTVTGVDALDKMRSVIVDSRTLDAYSTGELGDTSVFGG